MNFPACICSSFTPIPSLLWTKLPYGNEGGQAPILKPSQAQQMLSRWDEFEAAITLYEPSAAFHPLGAVGMK